MESFGKEKILFVKRSQTSKINSSSNRCAMFFEREKRTQAVIHVPIRPTSKDQWKSNRTRLYWVKFFFD